MVHPDRGMETILLIDDNQEILANVSEILELEHYRVLTATNGQAGVDIVNKEMPDLIICDITMPVLDGFGVFLMLNKNLRTAGIPFIFLTGNTDPFDKKQAIALGVEDFIVKPFDPEVLLVTIKSRIRKYERAKAELEHHVLNYINELEDMLQMVSHGVRAPLCTCMGLVQLIEKDANLTGVELNQVISNIKAKIHELDNFTRDLSSMMEKAQETKKQKLNIGKAFRK